MATKTTIQDTNLQTSESVEAPKPAIAASEPMVEVPVLNSDTGFWEMQKVDRSKGETIVAGMMTEGWERGGGDRMATDQYDGRMHRVWVCDVKSDPATVRAFELGYRPVRDSKSARNHGHQFGKVRDWGDESIVHMGDAVLMEVPVAMAEMMDQRSQEARRRERDQAQGMADQHMESVIDPYRANDDGKTGVMSAYAGQQMGYDQHTVRSLDEMLTSDTDNRSAMLAGSLQRAQDYASGSRGRVSYGGFRSAQTGFDSAIPESPLVKRLMDKQLGG